jgi:hypothetical protein
LSKASGLSPASAWHISRLAFFLAAYFLLFIYLRTWFAEAKALLGTVLVGATLPLTFTNSWAHPDHAAELALFTAGCHAVALGRAGWLTIILAVATLNRETAVFLVPLYLVSAPLDRRRVLITAGLAFEWAAIYLGLRAWRGFAHYDYLQIGRNIDFMGLLPENYDPYYRAYAYFGILLFGGLLVATFKAWRPGAPPFASRALLIVPLVAIVAFTISSIIESRIFTVLYPLVLPAVIFAVGGADTVQKPCETL